MAGDWIKMNKSLPRDPRVVRISSALKADRLRTVGGLLSAWCLADEQTADGKLDAYTPELLDELVGLPGLSSAMESVGWLVVGEGFLEIPRFDEHNGQSAKRRAQDSDRKMSARKADKRPQNKRTKSGPEKRREEKSITPISPDGDFNLTVEESTKPDSIRIKIGKMLGRRESTKWSDDEIVAYSKILPLHPDDIELMAAFYAADIPAEKDHRRTSLGRLLNHWNGELDKARAWKAQNR